MMRSNAGESRFGTAHAFYELLLFLRGYLTLSARVGGSTTQVSWCCVPDRPNFEGYGSYFYVIFLEKQSETIILVPPR